MVNRSLIIASGEGGSFSQMFVRTLFEVLIFTCYFHMSRIEGDVLMKCSGRQINHLLVDNFKTHLNVFIACFVCDRRANMLVNNVSLSPSCIQLVGRAMCVGTSIRPL